MRFKAPSVQRTSVTTASSESDALMIILQSIRLLVEQFLELFARLEEWDLLGRHRHGGPRFWIAPFLHAPRSETETSKPPNLRLVAVLQRVSDTIENRIDDDLCLPFRQCRDLLRDTLNDLRLRHVRFPFRYSEHRPAVPTELERHEVFETDPGVEIQLRKQYRQPGLDEVPQRKTPARFHHFRLTFDAGQFGR